MTLDEAHENTGAKVIYQAWPGQPLEEGVITSVNEHYVFVRYGAGYTSQATRPDALRFIDNLYLRHRFPRGSVPVPAPGSNKGGG